MSTCVLVRLGDSGQNQFRTFKIKVGLKRTMILQERDSLKCEGGLVGRGDSCLKRALIIESHLSYSR